MSKKLDVTESFWYKGYANRNVLLGQKSCHYLREDRTLNDLLSLQQTKI